MELDSFLFLTLHVCWMGEKDKFSLLCRVMIYVSAKDLGNLGDHLNLALVEVKEWSGYIESKHEIGIHACDAHMG